jgi:hypothetical protein
MHEIDISSFNIAQQGEVFKWLRELEGCPDTRNNDWMTGGKENNQSLHFFPEDSPTIEMIINWRSKTDKWSFHSHKIQIAHQSEYLKDSRLVPFHIRDLSEGTSAAGLMITTALQAFIFTKMIISFADLTDAIRFRLTFA